MAGAGRLIVFEGTEGVGKSTQAARLHAGLPGSLLVREPGGTGVGEQIRDLVLHGRGEIEPRTELLLFLAARAQLIPVIRQHLATGTTVILDRFFLSTYAYQGAGRGLPEDEIREANRVATAGLVPDLTFVLRYPVAAGLRRAGGQDRIERSGVDFHERVAAAFTRYVRAEWQYGHPECGPIVEIDAHGTVDEVAKRVWLALTGHWPEVQTWGEHCGHER
jgi:dTMP kinase